MKIQVTFNYDGVDYRYTVNEEQAEMANMTMCGVLGFFQDTMNLTHKNI